MKKDLCIKITPEKKKSITCTFCHVQAYIDQHQNQQKADLAVACETCPYGRECSYDWLHIMEPILNHSEVKIRLVRSGLFQQLDKDRGDCVPDKDSHHCEDKNIQ